MTKYLAPDVLEKAGIKYFDEWAANFGDIITAMELSTDGRTYKARSKFAQFTNVPELQMMFRSFADVKTKEDLNLPVPSIEVVRRSRLPRILRRNWRCTSETSLPGQGRAAEKPQKS